jgi:branched-chain amino acid transport system permease protein
MNWPEIYNVVDLMLVFGISATAQNLLVGYAGIPAVAPTGFGAIGGYLAAYLAVSQGWPTLAGLVVGVVAASAVGFMISVVALRLSVEYVILVTVAFAIVVVDAFTNFGPFGGYVGLIDIPALRVFGFSFNSTLRLLPLFAVVLALTYAFVRHMGESTFGVLLRALRDNESAARSIGFRAEPAKVAAFMVAAGFAGLAGGLLVCMEQVANPSSFGFTEGILVVAMLIIGGLGRPIGPVLGAFIVEAVPQILQSVVNVSATTASLLQQIIFGVLLVVIMIFRPRGITPEKPSARLRHIAQRYPSSSVVDGETAAPSPDVGTRVLAAEQLSKRFGGIQATSGFSFEVGRGEIVGLVGPNGAGKTTLFNLLSGEFKPDAGHVNLLARDCTGQRPDQIVEEGMVRSFQDVRLFTGLTVLENVSLAALPARSATFWRILLQPRRIKTETHAAVDNAMSVLARLGLLDKAQVLTSNLSFGEQKLVALARVMATRATVLLLDEPTAGVGSEYGRKLQGVIKDLHSDGATIVIIEHNLEVVRELATRILYMESGRIRAEGTFAELISSPVLAESYFGSVQGSTSTATDHATTTPSTDDEGIA